jgi:hypothetical protein
MNAADEVAAKPGAAGFDKKSDQQLHTIIENLGRVAHPDDLHSGFTSRLDLEALERKAIYDRLRVIENQMKRRGSGGFVRYLVAILIGVTATLAWQSYGSAAKQIIAARAPELGWSPGAKQMIANWVQQLGWTKPPAGPENTAVRPSALETLQAAPTAQTAPEPVASKAPAASSLSLDPEQMQQLTRSLTNLQQTAEQLAAGQDEMKRAIVNLARGVVEVLVRLPAPPPPQPPAAPARKPTPTPPPSSSRTPIPPHLRPHP